MGKRPGVDFLLVDLRRTDHEVLEKRSVFSLMSPTEAKVFIGWHNQGIHQSPCPEPVPQLAHSTELVSSRGREAGNLVLW